MDVQPGRCRTPPFTQGPGRTSLGHAESECPASHPKGRDTRSPAMKTQNARPFTEGSGYTFLRPRTPRMPHPTPRGRSERRTPHPSHRGGAYILHVRGLCLLHRAGIGRLSPPQQGPAVPELFPLRRSGTRRLSPNGSVPLFPAHARSGFRRLPPAATFHCSWPRPPRPSGTRRLPPHSTVPLFRHFPHRRPRRPPGMTRSRGGRRTRHRAYPTAAPTTPPATWRAPSSAIRFSGREK